MVGPEDRKLYRRRDVPAAARSCAWRRMPRRRVSFAASGSMPGCCRRSGRAAPARLPAGACRNRRGRRKFPRRSGVCARRPGPVVRASRSASSRAAARSGSPRCGAPDLPLPEGPGPALPRAAVVPGLRRWRTRRSRRQAGERLGALRGSPSPPGRAEHPGVDRDLGERIRRRLVTNAAMPAMAVVVLSWRDACPDSPRGGRWRPAPRTRCGHRACAMAGTLRPAGGRRLGPARWPGILRCRTDRRRRRKGGGPCWRGDRALRRRMAGSEVYRRDRIGSAPQRAGRMIPPIRCAAGDAEEPGRDRGERGKRDDRAGGPDAHAAPLRRRIDREVGKFHDDGPGSAVRAMPYGNSCANRCSAASMSPHSRTMRSIRSSSTGSVVETA